MAVKVVKPKVKKKRVQYQPCAYHLCPERFIPVRYWQKFCSAKCRQTNWEEAHPRSPAV